MRKTQNSHVELSPDDLIGVVINDNVNSVDIFYGLEYCHKKRYEEGELVEDIGIYNTETLQELLLAIANEDVTIWKRKVKVDLETKKVKVGWQKASYDDFEVVSTTSNGIAYKAIDDELVEAIKLVSQVDDIRAITMLLYLGLGAMKLTCEHGAGYDHTYRSVSETTEYVAVSLKLGIQSTTLSDDWNVVYETNTFTFESGD